ncbi:hypothetical protein [Spartinivicinus ruber]|uniref:hypothetical protein n=1 Tax=Spartinivicinus ruber TaxID=2683272 RepID=UPI001CA45ABC|nr:hypothetical protein [Spartinivicinus ruber]
MNTSPSLNEMIVAQDGYHDNRDAWVALPPPLLSVTLSFRAYCGILQNTQLNTDKILRRFEKVLIMSPYSDEVTIYLCG